MGKTRNSDGERVRIVMLRKEEFWWPRTRHLMVKKEV